MWNRVDWMKGVASRIDRVYVSDWNCLELEGTYSIIVDAIGDVNYKEWCGDLLRGHPIFKFDGKTFVEVTESNCDEFERVLVEVLCNEWSWKTRWAGLSLEEEW